MINIDGNPEFINDFLDYSATILNKSTNSIKEYNYDLNMFFKYIKMKNDRIPEKDYKSINIHDMTINDLKKIELKDIHSFLFFMTNNYNSKATTRARKCSTIRIFFNYMTQKTGMLEVNPAQNLETPKLDKRIPKYLSLEDSKKLLDAAYDEDDRNKERDFAIITLFLNCGMRLSELVGISLNDIDFSECKLNVIGKGNKERAIYLNKACMNAIKDYISVRPKNVSGDAAKALFLSERKERISNRTVQYIVKNELKKAGLDTNKYSVHKLRHTAATLMYKYGEVDIRALQELLGHKSISTTEIYTHVDNEQARHAVESNPLANL